MRYLPVDGILRLPVDEIFTCRWDSEVTSRWDIYLYNSVHDLEASVPVHLTVGEDGADKHPCLVVLLGGYQTESQSPGAGAVQLQLNHVRLKNRSKQKFRAKLKTFPWTIQEITWNQMDVWLLIDYLSDTGQVWGWHHGVRFVPTIHGSPSLLSLLLTLLEFLSPAQHRSLLCLRNWQHWGGVLRWSVHADLYLTLGVS